MSVERLSFWFELSLGKSSFIGRPGGPVCATTGRHVLAHSIVILRVAMPVLVPIVVPIILVPVVLYW